ncbi:MAG: MFS transporter [Defluviitaleaceae bacterium]|nr:MFS transporter [Defluviitaleaceae bacterium]
MKKISAGLLSFIQEMRQIRGTNVWIFIMYGLLFDMVGNLWRPFASVFLTRLGGTEFHIAMLSSLPGLVAAAVLLPGAILFRRFTNQKRATASFIIISRAVLVFIALIPALPPAVRPLLFVILVAIMNCPDSLSQTSLQNFLGVVFSGQMRGQAIAMRTKFGQAMIPIVTISSGLAITFLPNIGQNPDELRMVLYQIFFVGAFLLGIVEVIVFNRLQVPDYMQTQEPTNTTHPPASQIIKSIFKDKKFRLFAVPTIIFVFTWQAGWPLNNIYQIMTLGATEMWFAIFALISGLAAFLSGGYWQKVMHRHGNDRVFIIAAALITVNMFIFPLIPNVQIMAAFSAFTGMSAVGINMAILNGLLDAAPNENRMTYLAFFNTLSNLSLFAAPFLAHAMLSAFGLRTAMVAVGFLRVGGMVVVLVGRWFKKKEAIHEQA